MEHGIFWAIYFIVGMTYTLINGFVRKLDTDGDWLLPMVWIGMWPIAFTSLAIKGISEYYEKRCEKRTDW